MLYKIISVTLEGRISLVSFAEEFSEVFLILEQFNIITAYLGCLTVLYSTVCSNVTTVNTISASNKLNISGHLKQTLDYTVSSQPAPIRVTSQGVLVKS